MMIPNGYQKNTAILIDQCCQKYKVQKCAQEFTGGKLMFEMLYIVLSAILIVQQSPLRCTGAATSVNPGLAIAQ